MASATSAWVSPAFLRISARTLSVRLWRASYTVGRSSGVDELVQELLARVQVKNWHPTGKVGTPHAHLGCQTSGRYPARG
jgi:hypothetical protein